VEAAENLSHWAHGGGFSLHASVLVDAQDRAALERLLRYCAQPAFASERIVAMEEPGEDERIRNTFAKPRAGGPTALVLTPLELLDRLAALIPPPRRRRPYFPHFADVIFANLRRPFSCGRCSFVGTPSRSST
jgi:hypothetical protein